VIQRISVAKGFFFVRDDAGHDYFCHRSEIQGGWRFDALAEGMAVEFLPVPDAPKGPRATDLRVL
jgi:cold shock CspA family protein